MANRLPIISQTVRSQQSSGYSIRLYQDFLPVLVAVASVRLASDCRGLSKFAEQWVFSDDLLAIR
jgi:hypothetical protein